MNKIEKTKEGYVAPCIMVMHCECQALLSGSITGEGDDFEWGAKGDYGFDRDDTNENPEAGCMDDARKSIWDD